MSKNMKDVKAKVEADMKEFVDEVVSLDDNALNNRLAALAKSMEEVVDSRDNDEALQNAKEEIKQMSAPYREAIRDIRLKSKYIVLMMKDRKES